MNSCKTLVSAAVGAALLGCSAGVLAGGFAIGTQSGSGTGNAFAGGAAAVDDASIAWFNPAGMTLLPGTQIAGALHVVKPSFKFQNQGSTGAYATGGDGGDGGDVTFIPNGFMTMAINPSLSFGLALNVPFGLKTEYDNGWRGQFQALKSEIKTVNINPSLAYKISPAVSVGAGVNVQRIEAELSSFAGAAGVSTLSADDMGYGYNLGIMINASPSTRIGASYRSKIKFDLEGSATFTGVPALNGNVRADLEVPDTASLSLFHGLTPQWELMADITWTGWSSVQQLNVIRTSGPGAGTTLTTLPFQWDDTMRYGVGANYKMSNQTKLRFGLAFDETPTNSTTRTPRLPDNDRTWVAFGVQYKPSKNGILDVGYAHEFVKSTPINSTQAGVPGNLVGNFDSKVDILSLQYSYSF